MTDGPNDAGSGNTGSSELSLDSARDVFAGLLSSEDTETGKAPSSQSDASASTNTDTVQAQGAEGEEPDPKPATSEEGEPSTSDEEQQQATESDPPVSKHKIKVDGEELEVTLDEALKGYSRTQDYTRKTQALAEQRKLTDAELATLQSERAMYREGLTQIEKVLTDATPKEPDWAALRASNPDLYASTWAAWDQHTKQLERVRAESARVDAEAQRDAELQHSRFLSSERENLVKALPVLADPDKGRAEMTKLQAYGKSVGFTDAELQAVADHRAVVLLHKAMMFDAMQSVNPTQKKPSAPTSAIKTASPGPNAGGANKPATETTRAKQALAKTGKARDAARVFESLL